MPSPHTRTALRTALAAVLAGATVALVADPSAADEQPQPSVAVVVDLSQVSAAARTSVEARLDLDFDEIYGTELGVADIDADALAAVAARLRAAGTPIESLDQPVRIAADPTDPYWSQQWGHHQANSTVAWDRTSGSETVVAVLDTGVNVTSELTGRVMPGYDFVDDDTTPTDPHGHGTTVATVAAAAHSNGVGGAGACGGCRILPVRVLEADGGGSMSDIAAGINWAVDNGADVINLSLGGSSGITAVAAAVDRATAAGVVVIAAAGNDGSTQPTYPAAYPNALAVAAIDETADLYSWSNRGSWIDVSAAGVNIAQDHLGSTVSFAGTSSSTPLVAGITALALTIDDSLDLPSLRSRFETGTPITDGGHQLDAAGVVLPGGSTAPTVAATVPVPAFATVTIAVTVTDSGGGVGDVTAAIDGTAVAVTTGTTGDRSITWNSATVTDGAHTLLVRATDDVGNLGSTSISFTVANNPDTLAAGRTGIAGDFNGDGHGDVFLYRAGATSDLARWGAGNGIFTRTTHTVNGTYKPLAGDFNGDGRDDVFWYAPGSAVDSLWFGNANRTFTGGSVANVRGTYWPVVGDFNGDGRDDVFWYAPGSAVDSLWFGNANRTFTGGSVANVHGTYQVLTGAFHGGPGDDVIFYGATSGQADPMWSGNANRTFSSARIGIR